MRAFIAVDAPDISFLAKLQTQLVQAGGWARRDVKTVEPENFHFTLLFLGEVDEGKVGDINNALATIHFSKISIKYTRVGAFPSLNSARVIWAGLDTESGAELTSLAAQVQLQMANLGFRPDKPFSPHLTLLRSRDRPLRAESALEKINAHWPLENDTIHVIDKLHLKKSDLQPSGPVYSNVYTVEASPAL